MAGPIDIAYVKILPDLKGFDKQATAEVKSALKGVSKEADKASKDIGESLAGSFTVAAGVADKELDGIQRHIKEVDGVIRVRVVVDGKEIDRVIKRDVNGRFREKGRFISAGEVAGLGIATGIGNGISEGVEGLGKGATGLGKTVADGVGSGLLDGLGQVGKSISTLTAASGPIGAAVTALVAVLAVQFAGAAVALTAAIGPAVVALGASIPAAAGIAGVALGTVALGFRGISDALDNMDDVEKFNEALKKLSPSARNFVLEIKGLMPVLSSIKAAASEGLFRGFEGQLTRIVTVLAGPLKNGFDQVGQALQRAATQFGAFLTSTTGINLVNTLFDSTSKVIDNISKGLGPLAQGLANLSIKSTPFIEKLSLKFGEFLGNIGTKLSEAADSGKLEKFFDKAYETLKKVWEISKNVYDILKSIFGPDAEISGQMLLDDLKEITSDLKKISESKTFIDALKLSFIALSLSVGSTMAGIRLFSDALKANDKYIEGRKKSIQNIGEFFKQADKDILASGATVRTAIANFFIGADEAILANGASVRSGIAKTFIGIDDAIIANGATVRTSIANFFIGADEAIIANGASVRTAIVEFFKSAWEEAKRINTEAVESIVGFIAGLPDRITALAGRMYSAGINFINGLFGGIADGASGGAGGIGDAILGALKRAINGAVDEVNAGISRINSIVGSNISTIPYLAKGGLALGPSLMGESGPELAIPLSGARGQKALKQVSEAAMDGTKYGEGPGTRMWAGAETAPIEIVVSIESSGSKIDDFLLEFFRKAIRVRGGNVQKVLGKPVGGAV